MKNGNEARVVGNDSSKRCRATKNQKDCTIRYCSEKQTITIVLSGKVFGKKRVRSASGDLDRYCG